MLCITRSHVEPPLAPLGRHWPSQRIVAAPMWCAVDLRDGNQALPNPMDPRRKLEYFQLLCKIGFKSIEVGFPSASQDEFDFVRLLIEGHHVPDDVTIMVLTQCRPHLIERTFQSLRGVPRAIVHAYIATSPLHMQHVFGLTEDQTIETAVAATKQIRRLAEELSDSAINFQFSPEEFTDTDPCFAVQICQAVYQAWGRATPDQPVIFNLPATVERRPPYEVADLFEYFCTHFRPIDFVLISAHAHNDQGMAVASTEMALLAGANRVEGTLFGHGERTGNVDLVTLALNLEARGIPTGLDFLDLPTIVATVERLTGLPVSARQPYAGELVFTAFSGSHQDAIGKGMRRQQLKDAPRTWKVPYLLINPAQVGRAFEPLIRINTQSGKGGIAWVMEQEHGIQLPKRFQPSVGEAIQRRMDKTGGEVSSAQMLEWFDHEFINPAGPYQLIDYWPRPDEIHPDSVIHGEVKISVDGVERIIKADGNGPIDAFVKAINQLGINSFTVGRDYSEQALGEGGSAARALAFVPLEFASGVVIWGVGSQTSVDQAAVRAIVAALNRHAAQLNAKCHADVVKLAQE